MWEIRIGHPSQLVVEIPGRCFAFQGIHMEIIQKRKGEGRLRPISGGWVKPHVEELGIEWLSIWTAAGPQLVVKDTLAVH